MNKQNFRLKDRFPVSTSTMEFMQEMIFVVSQLAKIAGRNYILSGCTLSNGGMVSSGIIVINGELITFVGGAILDMITIIEKDITVVAKGLVFDKARTIREAKFANGSGSNFYRWLDFKPLTTNIQLDNEKPTIPYVDNEIAKIQGHTTPNGIIVMWSGDVGEIPVGWQLCDGEPIIGSEKLTPNLCSRFIVGYDTENTDFDTVGKMGGLSEVTLHSAQIPAHSHKYFDHFKYDASSAGGGGIPLKEDAMSTGGAGVGSMHTKEFSTSNTERGLSHENKPPYYVLAFIIKTSGLDVLTTDESDAVYDGGRADSVYGGSRILNGGGAKD